MSVLASHEVCLLSRLAPVTGVAIWLVSALNSQVFSLYFVHVFIYSVMYFVSYVLNKVYMYSLRRNESFLFDDKYSYGVHVSIAYCILVRSYHTK